MAAIPKNWMFIVAACIALLIGCAAPAAPALTPAPSPTPANPGPPPEIGPPYGVEFESLSLEQGLSQSVVMAILQDSQGFLWLGTQDGLNRYDGYEFVTYRHDPADPSSLSDNFIQALYEDEAGFLWIGTHGGGINRFDPRTRRFTAFRHDPDDPAVIGHNNVMAIRAGQDGALWLGTSAGLNRLDPATGQITRYPHDAPDDPGSLSGSSVQAVAIDDEGMVWAGAFDGGLSRLDPAAGRVQVYRKQPDDPGSLPDDNVQALLVDRAGTLWVGTLAGGLARLDRGAGQFIRYQHDLGDATSLASNNVKALFEDRAGNLWVGTDSGGLDRFDRDTGGFIHHTPRPEDPRSLNNGTVQSLYEDRGGILWVGTFGGGVNKSDPYARKFAHYRHDPADPVGLNSNLVWAFAEAQDGAVWIGTLDAGLNRLDPESGTFTHFRHDPADPASLASDQIWSALVDRDGNLWSGTSAGLDRLDTESGVFTHIAAPPTFAMHQTGDGLIWLATGGGGLGRLDPATGQIVYFQNKPNDESSLSADFLTSVLEEDGTLWIGTFDSGLNRLDDPSSPPDAARFVRFRNHPDDPSSLGHDTVLDLHRDRKGALWVATSRGLDRLDPEAGTFTHYGVREGLANALIYAVLEDDAGNLWLSTNRGLSRLDPNTGAVRNYTPRDGLQSIEFNQGATLRANDGTMYFGGINGFNAFDPAEVRDRNYAPPVVLTHFELFNEDVPIGEDAPLRQAIERAPAITLSYAQDFFSFEFAALDYAAPDLIRYAYKMEGLDKDWNDAGDRRFAGYTNVPPGEYTFRVRGTNSDGAWSEPGASVRVVVTPPFWQTWPFRAAVALALAAGVVGVYRLRVRSLELRSCELEAQVEKRTREIEQRREELAALYRADEELYSHLELDEVLAALTEIAVHILHADRSAVLTWDDERRRPAVCAAHGFADGELASLAESRGGPAEEAARIGQPIIISGDGAGMEDGQPPGVRASMHLPIRALGDVFGVFCVGYEAPHIFSGDEQRLFLALAQRAAIAIENARLYELGQQNAVLEERGRLARDLHDAVTQNLFSASLIAEALPAIWEADQVEGAELLRELRQLSRGALAEMRTLLLELRPAALADAALPDLLRQLSEAASGRMGAPVTLTVDGRCDLPEVVRINLYRIAQEALNNVVKHSHAGQVSVSLICREADGGGEVELTICDDGCGFDLDTTPPDHLGLGIIRERAQAIGAVLHIASRPGEGATVSVCWPGEP